MYFTVITVSFLIRFCDMFVSGVNPDVDTKVIAFLILCICVYGASKGINPLSRVSIFVFAFLIIAFAVIIFRKYKIFRICTEQHLCYTRIFQIFGAMLQTV